jgi:flagellar protein FliL
MATAPKKAAKPVPAESSDTAAPPKSKKKLFIILGLVVVLLAGGGAGAWWFLGQPAQDGKSAAAKKPEPPVFINMDAFTVNLQNDGGNDQFLQTTFTMQVASQGDVDNLKLYQPQVRSRILLLLSSKTAAELTSVEGKRKLADEIIGQTRKPFAPNAPEVKVNDVFFTSFVIQ